MIRSNALSVPWTKSECYLAMAGSVYRMEVIQRINVLCS